MIKINKEIISFNEIPEITAASEQSVLLLRHSYRESLQNGNYDPALTAEGWNYAVECGKFLKGIKNICFGSSVRKRTVETIQALSEGAGFECRKIECYSQIYDTAMFTCPENLESSVENGQLPAMLKEYFSTGNAPGMVGIKEFSSQLLEFLISDSFSERNTILASHDIIIVALLSALKVYDFVQHDWCGYIHGAFLYRQNGTWNIAYCVPDAKNRKLTQLFI